VKQDGNGRGKFRHPTIVVGVRYIFFNDTVNMHLAKMPNSEGSGSNVGSSLGLHDGIVSFLKVLIIK
jgi:hypothetical protein